MYEKWFSTIFGAFFLWGLVEGSPSPSKEAMSSIATVINEDMARVYLQQNIENVPKIKLVVTNRKEKERPRNGETNAVFAKSDESYLFDGREIFRLDGNPRSSGLEFSPEKAPDVRPEEGPVLFRNYFYWEQDLAFDVVCYRKGYCQVFVSAQGGKKFNWQFDTGTAPLDVRFFLDDEELLLIIVKDPCLVYRWTGTYFDQQDTLDTTGARSVAVFRNGKNSVIAVAQNLGAQKVHSKVFVRKNKKTELIQLLPTSGALKMKHFSVTSKQEVYDFVFVLNEMTSSSIYWWNGKELSLWKSVDDILGSGILHVDHVLSETFLFLSNKNEVRVYRPTPNAFEPVLILPFDSNVVDLGLKRMEGEPPVLIVLTRSGLGPFLKLSVLTLEVVYLPVVGDQIRERDPILVCLTRIYGMLTERQFKASENAKITEALPVIGEVRVVVLTSEETRIDQSEVTYLAVNPPNVTSAETLKETKTEIARLLEEIGRLNASDPVNKIYRVRGDAKIGKLKADGLFVKKLGEKTFRIGDFLSLTKNQNLGRVKVVKSSAEDLKVSSVRGIDVKDILLKSKPRQEIIGEQTLKSLKATNVRFGEGGKINGILFSDLTTKEQIKGEKTFSEFRTQNLQVEKINGVPAAEWSSKILPGFKSKPEPGAPLEFSELNVENLKISHLNDLSWEDFKNSFFLPEENDTISGSLFCTGKTKITNLHAGKLNGVLPKEILTKSGDQKIDCGIKSKNIKANSIKPKYINGSENNRMKEILIQEGSSGRALQGSEKNCFNDWKVERDVHISEIYFNAPANVSGQLIDSESIEKLFYLRNAPQEINVPVSFAKTTTVRASLNPKKINGKPSESLVFADGSKAIDSPLIFEKATVLGNVTTNESTDRNVRLHDLDLRSVKKTEKNYVSGEKRFLSSVSAKKLEAEIGTPEDLFDLDFETEEIRVLGNATVRNGATSRNLNGRPFEETTSNLLLANDSSLFQYGIYRSLVVNNLTVEKLNDFPVPSFDRVKLPDNLTIEGDLTAPKILAKKINGFDFDDYVRRVAVKSEGEILIKGEKRFQEKTRIADLSGNLEDYDAVDFEQRALSKTKIQNITALYRIEDVKANSLFAETLDGIKTDDLIFQDDSNIPKIDSDLVFSDLIVAGNVTSSDFMDGCDLNKIVEKNLEIVQNFGSLHVKEDLVWKNPEENLSRLFANAVKVDGDEIITNRVVFEGDVFSDTVATKRHVNDVDLKVIVENALYCSPEKQKISQGVFFKGNITADNVLVLKNTLLDRVAGVDVLDFDSRIVRKDAVEEIEGRKEFRNGLSTENLYAELINGIDTGNIIFYDDSKVLPATTCESFKVSDSLQVEKVDDVILEDLIGKRWCKAQNQTLTGNVILKGTIKVEQDSEIIAIDDVKIADVIPLEGETGKTIFGKIEFTNAIAVDGNLKSESLNGYDLAGVKRNGFSKNDNAEILGNVVFAENVSIDGDIRIIQNTNGRDVEEVAAVETMENRIASEIKTVENILASGKNVTNPFVFMYLTENSTLDLDFIQIHGSDLVDYGDSVQIRIRGFGKDSCGLPDRCLCPVQTLLEVKSDGNVFVGKDFPRQFRFFDRDSRSEVLVKTSSVSYDKNCKQDEEKLESERNLVVWKRSGMLGEAKLGNGYLENVKFFRLGDSVYVVAAFTFPESRTVVYEVNVSTGKAVEIDNLEDSRLLEVFWTFEGIVMVTGNRVGDSVGIYRFKESENKFSLMRSVPTHGVTAVKSMRHKKENYIFVVQKRSWPLLILKYDPDEDDYRVKQKKDATETDARADFLSVSVMLTPESKNEERDVFVGIVHSDDSFGLFKYKHVEGFVMNFAQEQENVKLLQPFRMDSEQYLLAVSALRPSKIYKFVKQGRTLG